VAFIRILVAGIFQQLYQKRCLRANQKQPGVY